MPRRAVLHRYPVVGRFAHRLRRFDPLWSFRRRDVRKAYYIGSIISFLPLIGVQLSVVAVASVLFRCNIMVAGGLQFLTNPVTAAPVYYATHQLGKLLLGETSVHGAPARQEELADLGELVADTLIDDKPGTVKMTQRVRSALRALIVGGVVTGVVFGALLDVADYLLRARAHRHGQASRSLPGRAPPDARAEDTG